MKIVIGLCLVILTGCAKVVYTEKTTKWPIFHYYMPTYPQFYLPYYYLPELRINPPKTIIKKKNNNIYKQRKL
jgi:hypothetical protein